MSDKFISTARRSRSAVCLPPLHHDSWSLLALKVIGTDDATIGATVSGRDVSIPRIQDMVVPCSIICPGRVKVVGLETVPNYRKGSEMLPLMLCLPFKNVGLHKTKQLSRAAKQRSMFKALLVVQSPGFDFDEIIATKLTAQIIQRLHHKYLVKLYHVYLNGPGILERTRPTGWGKLRFTNSRTLPGTADLRAVSTRIHPAL